MLFSKNLISQVQRDALDFFRAMRTAQTISGAGEGTGTHNFVCNGISVCRVTRIDATDKSFQWSLLT